MTFVAASASATNIYVLQAGQQTQEWFRFLPPRQQWPPSLSCSAQSQIHAATTFCPPIPSFCGLEYRSDRLSRSDNVPTLRYNIREKRWSWTRAMRIPLSKDETLQVRKIKFWFFSGTVAWNFGLKLWSTNPHDEAVWCKWWNTKIQFHFRTFKNFVKSRSQYCSSPRGLVSRAHVTLARCKYFLEKSLKRPIPGVRTINFWKKTFLCISRFEPPRWYYLKESTPPCSRSQKCHTEFKEMNVYVKRSDWAQENLNFLSYLQLSNWKWRQMVVSPVAQIASAMNPSENSNPINCQIKNIRWSSGSLNIPSKAQNTPIDWKHPRSVHWHRFRRLKTELAEKQKFAFASKVRCLLTDRRLSSTRTKLTAWSPYRATSVDKRPDLWKEDENNSWIDEDLPHFKPNLTNTYLSATRSHS